MDQLAALAAVFSYLSLLTVGGGMAAFPELKVQVVDVHHWLTSDQLIHIYSVGQMAPGPNMMMVAAVGVQVSGVAGACIAALAFFVPTGVLTYGVGRLWKRLDGWPWRDSIQLGLAPVAIGLAVAGTITLGKGAITGWLTALISLAVFFATLRTKLNPALLIFVGAIIGAVALKK
jgi:chromate transporter